MTPYEKRGWSAGDKFVINNNRTFFHCFAVGDEVTLIDFKNGSSPFFERGMDGMRQYVSAEDVTPLRVALRPGDYVDTKGMNDEEYHAVARAFMAAGAERDEYRENYRPNGIFQLFGWEAESNGLAHWNCADNFGDNPRLLTIAQVLGTATAEWDGAGLPPVGSVIKINTTSHRYRDHNGECVTVIAILKDPEDDMDFIVAMNDTAGYVAMRPSAFEPFNAEQQRLTEELQQAANIKPKQAERVIAAGYRKEVVK